MTSAELKIENLLLENNIKEIKCIDDAYRISLLLNKYFNSEYIVSFRGETDFDWILKANLIRELKNESKTKIIEKQKQLINYFFDLTSSLTTKRKPLSKKKYCQEWDNLCFAQHAKIKTILLDITTNIEIALFFATESTESNDKVDGKIWCIFSPRKHVRSHLPESPSLYDIDPYNIDNTLTIFNPILIDDLDNRLFEKRVMKQNGGFLVAKTTELNTPINEINDSETIFLKLKIPKESKNHIKDELRKIGKTKKTIYVKNLRDIDALAKKVNKSIFQ